MDAVREFVTGDEEMEKEKMEKEREKKRGEREVAQGTVGGCFKTLNINTRGG